jgi:cobalt-zinc-cadmium efflux system outer membrane protein
VIALVLAALLASPPESGSLDRPTAADRGETAIVSGGVLALADVLDSVFHHDPRLTAADREIAYAEGQVLSARGGFDTTINFTQYYEPLYRNAISRVLVEQNTPFWGLTVWAGYHIGISGNPQSTVPVWDPGSAGRLLTATAGEIFVGATLPLVRDSWTDRRRTDIKVSTLERERADHARDATQLQLELDAATAYWNWVAAGLEMQVEQRLLALATTRNDKILRQIELGAVDRIVGVDNKRLILDRQARVVGAERSFQAAALELSLYLRDGSGDPMVAGADRLPNELPAMKSPETYDLPADIDAALAQRPDRLAQQRVREQTDVELRWARNQRTPRVDLSFWASRELGRNYFLDAGELAGAQPTEIFTSVHIEIPIPMRTARGQVKSAEASIDIVSSQLRLLDNQITVEVSNAHQALIAAYQRALLAGEQVALTEELADAELRRFELGGGDMLEVNLRELSVAETAVGEVRAVADYFIAKANLEAAKGEGVQPVAP